MINLIMKDDSEIKSERVERYKLYKLYTKLNLSET